jgi:hypothetical protein
MRFYGDNGDRNGGNVVIDGAGRGSDLVLGAEPRDGLTPSRTCAGHSSEISSTRHHHGPNSEIGCFTLKRKPFE